MVVRLLHTNFFVESLKKQGHQKAIAGGVLDGRLPSVNLVGQLALWGQPPNSCAQWPPAFIRMAEL